ncbi:Biotin carboxyl carrier protein of acetyl-CoA carboxylase [bacterium HR26]|nr:Biotin carboxyl carrier protein of acetyl-CoA carboxylase [bacterium HR26]
MAPRDRQHQASDYAALTQAVRELVEVMQQAGLLRLEVVHGELRIALEAGAAPAPARVAAPSHNPVPIAAPSPTSLAEEVGTFTIDAPMVGTFYAAPAPDAEPFVRVGDLVEPGQTVAIIEAMKIMNEIVAERAGEVVAILVENGQAVEYGQPLMRLRSVEPGP